MRLPRWLRTKHRERVGDTVEATLELDTSQVEAAFRDLQKSMERVSATMGFAVAPAFRRMAYALAAPARHQEVRQAGLEARYYVRGAMDPTYATPEARDAYVKVLMENWAWGWPPVERAGHAAAFLRGWVEHHPEPVCACWRTPESMHYVYYGITEPGSAWEWNPDCPVHRPEPQPMREDCHAAGQGPCVAACCPIRGMGMSLACPPTHVLP